MTTLTTLCDPSAFGVRDLGLRVVWAIMVWAVEARITRGRRVLDEALEPSRGRPKVDSRKLKRLPGPLPRTQRCTRND